MKNDEFNIEHDLKETKPINYNFTKTKFYNVSDLLDTVNNKKDIKKISSVEDFINLLNKNENLVCLQRNNLNIVCKKEDFDSNLGERILQNYKKSNVYDEFDEDFDDEDVVIKPVNKNNNVFKRQENDFKRQKIEQNKKWESSFKSNNDKYEDDNKETKYDYEKYSNYKKNHDKNKVNNYESTPYLPVTISKDKKDTLLTSSEFKVSSKFKASTEFKTYSEVKSMLLEAFEDALAVVVGSLGLATSAKFGIAFDYRKMPCKIGFHPHGSLSKYILCCNDIFSLVDANPPFIKRVDIESKAIIQKRKNVHLNGLKNQQLGKYHLEYLIVNIFPVRTTVEVSELSKIFSECYEVSLESVCNDIIKVIISLGSPNLIVNRTKRVTVTLVPIYSEDYKMWGDQELLAKVHGMNNIEELANAKDELKGEVIINAKLDEITKKLFDRDDYMMSLANLNVPRCIQVQNSTDYLTDYLKHFESNVDLGWIYVNQNVKIGVNNSLFLV